CTVFGINAYYPVLAYRFMQYDDDTAQYSVRSQNAVSLLQRGSNRGWKYSNTPNTSQAGVNRIVLAMWSLNLCCHRQPQLRLLQPPCSWPVTPRIELSAAQRQTNPSKSPPD